MTNVTDKTNIPGARLLFPVSGGSAMLRLLRPIWRRFEAAARDPEAAQRTLWADIAREAEGSPMWGERWGRSGAPPLAELPITEYADYAEAFERAFEQGGAPTATRPVDYWAGKQRHDRRETQALPVPGGQPPAAPGRVRSHRRLPVPTVDCGTAHSRAAVACARQRRQSSALAKRCPGGLRDRLLHRQDAPVGSQDDGDSLGGLPAARPVG